MSRKGSLKIFGCAFLILFCAWIALPKVYLNAWLGQHHLNISAPAAESIAAPETEDCDFDQYEKPAYFNLFRFISRLIPVQPSKPDHRRRTLNLISLQTTFVSTDKNAGV